MTEPPSGVVPVDGVVVPADGVDSALVLSSRNFTVGGDGGGGDGTLSSHSGGCMCGRNAPPAPDFVVAGRADGFSAAICVACCGARRVGNMTLLWQDMGSSDDEDEGGAEEQGRPRPRRRDLRPSAARRFERVCMVGPFWPCMVFITYPLITVAVYGILFVVFPATPWVVRVPLMLLTLFVLVALGFTACSNPGLVKRHAERPDTPDGATWVYSDQAKTYRPLGAIYCSDCGVIVEEFDHLCPWTGTAIGAGNMPYFNTFVSSLCCLLTLALGVALGDAMKLW